MGYYTDYDVKIRGLKGVNRDKFVEDLKSICPDMMFSMDEDLSGDYSFLGPEDYDEVDTYFNAKWYQCEEEIGDISFKHPELEFTIYCRGEDGEMWVVYGCNGEIESYKAEVKYPEPTVFKKKKDGE